MADQKQTAHMKENLEKIWELSYYRNFCKGIDCRDCPLEKGKWDCRKHEICVLAADALGKLKVKTCSKCGAVVEE